MHPLFSQVLVQKNLSKAGDLFSLEDQDVVNDFEEVLTRIQDIITQPDFLTNYNDHSLVEICITRLTSAIRETRTIEIHAARLVSLLETCLSYNLRQSGNNGKEPPHAKIASDVMSCIFLNNNSYSKKNVMELAVPVSVKFLHKGNKELSRNMSSYLSLAAIENGALLAQHIQPIIDSVISGNYSLARTLPTIYVVNKDPINNHVMTLVSILPNCENTEKLALLSLFGYIAKDNPLLLEPSVPQLCESLTSQSTAAATLQVLHNIALTKPHILADHMSQYKRTADDFPKAAMAAIQVMCAIAKVKQDKAQDVMDFILSTIGRLESEKHSLVLKEIIGLTSRYPQLLTANVVNKVSNLEDGASQATRSHIQELRNEFNAKSREQLMSAGEVTSVSSGVTIVKVGGSKTDLLPPTPSKTQHIYQQQQAPSKFDSRSAGVAGSSGGSRTRLDKSTGRFQPTHRSMTKLNLTPASSQTGTATTNGGFDSRLGWHKSMTRLNASHQNMARFSSSSQVAPQVARSVTCIANSGGGGGSSRTPYAQGQGYVGQGYIQGRATVGHAGGPGSSSPTKSMSSGSMTGMTCSTADGREVLTVNVNQINADLLRQASSVLSQHHDINEFPPVAPLPTSSYTSIPMTTHSTYVHHYHHHLHSSSHHPILAGNSNAASAPFSLPSHSSRRVPPYNSGPLPTLPSSQPPSLGLPPPSSSSATPLQSHHPLPSLGASSSGAVHLPSLGQQQQQRPHSSIFSNTLPSPRRRAALDSRMYGEGADIGGSVDEGKNGQEHEVATNNRQNRISVFEPYPMRDTVQHFCEKHLDKIKSYMTSLAVKLPLPVKCTIEERKGRKHAKLHFACQGRSAEYCLYKTTFYAMKTRNPRTWIHLMFLALQARSSSAISTRETSVSALKHCWEILKCDSISFVTLVTGAFPPTKDQDSLLHELRSHRFFDVFEYNGPKQHWGCFLCNHPDRAMNFMQENEPVIEGQLKEKKGGKWKLFKKWKSRYFTLSGAKLTYKETNGETGVTQSLDVGSIRSVKVTKEGRRNIPKAFEIFTNDKTFILKAKDGSNAQEWVQCLSVAKAHSQARDTNLRKLAYAGSLGRLNHHGRAALNTPHASLANSNIALRTAV